MAAPRRLLLKLSGEAFQGEAGPLSPESIAAIARDIASLSKTELGIVVGGGNILRDGRSPWLDRVEADTLGMLATIVNGLALRAALVAAGREAIVQSAVATELTEPISARKARQALASGAVVIFAGGTGNPFVTTDTAAAIRAASIEADLLAKGSNVAGVYSEDPRKGKKARLIPELSYDEYLAGRFGVMDLAAVEICRDQKIPIAVFDLAKPGALAALAAGKRVGTLIS
ncbi:MAG: UMP kinase [Candidatus Bipolaricaulota bacterium]|nr:UMP kinase [Candidatus Bipolaricaulota bacterium]